MQKEKGNRKTERLQAFGENASAHIERAATILRAGGTVAFPTETVYGLGANALDAHAVAGIFAAKERPHWDPLIVHVCDREMLRQVTCHPDLFVENGQGTIQKLLDAFWPGPLTLLLPRSASVPDAVTAGRPLVGVRMPAHPVALALTRAAGIPLAAPSANRFGHTSPTTAAHVLDDLDGRIDAVLDGGPCAIGIESTVVEPTLDGLNLYRPGAISIEALDEVLGRGKTRQLVISRGTAEPEALPSPGLDMRHYAPRARLILVEAGPQGRPDLELQAAVTQALERSASVGVMVPTGWLVQGATARFAWGDWENGAGLARRLFAGLRSLDDAGVKTIICPLPNHSGGITPALRDRLEKAARTS